jgi:flagellar biosynthesis protein FlhF
MSVKRFTARDMKTALTKVKEELGPNAVILSAQEYSEADGRLPLVEVTAVAAEPALSPAPGWTETEAGPGAWADNGSVSGNGAKAALEDLSHDMTSIKDMLLNLIYSSRLSERMRDRRDLVLLYRDMVEAEVEPMLARKLIEQVAAKSNGLPPAGLLMKKLPSLLKTCDPLGLSNGHAGPRRVFLVGPSGSGKTTTLAKLAALAAGQGERSVGIVSLDGYRLGAAEQLKAYARIMGLPFRLAQDAEEFQEAMALFQDLSLTLIDTPGRSLSDPVRFEELGRLVRGTQEAAVLLVLSALTKTRSLQAAMERTEGLRVQGLILTMIDETDRFGNVINALLRGKMPVCYLTHGQRVPGDILPASPERLAGLLDFGRGEA